MCETNAFYFKLLKSIAFVYEMFAIHAKVVLSFCIEKPTNINDINNMPIFVLGVTINASGDIIIIKDKVADHIVLDLFDLNYLLQLAAP